MPSKTTWMLTALVGLAATPALAADFEGGQWRHETKLVSAEVPGIPQSLIKIFANRAPRLSCYKPEQSAEDLLTADDGAKCDLRRLSASGGRLVFDTFCTNKRFPDGLLVASRGSYTPTTYSISTTSTGTKNGKPVKIVTTGAGKRVAESCGKP